MKAHIICHVDDISMLAPSANGLPKLLNLLCISFGQVGLSVNTEKSA